MASLHRSSTTLDELEQQESYGAEDEKLALRTSQDPPKKRSTAYLDGLRGLAALTVFNTHLMGGGDHEMGYGQLYTDGSKRNWHFISLPFVRSAYCAPQASVSIFFVLSGFVVTQTLVKLIRDDKHKQIARTVASAAVRRPIRLYLPCWCVAFFVAMAIYLPANIYPPLPWLQPRDSIFEEFPRWIETCWTWFWPFKRHYANQPLFIYDLVVWTIPIELHGSFICYGLASLYALATWSFGLNSPINIWSVVTLSVGVVALLLDGGWWQACFVAGFILSIIDAFAMDQPLLGRSFEWTVAGKRRLVSASNIALYCIFISSWYLVTVVQASANPEWNFLQPGYGWLFYMVPEVYTENKIETYRFWVSVGAMGVVYATLRIGWLQRFFNTPPLQYLGKISFMFYLIHLPFAYSFSDRVTRLFGHIGWAAAPKWWDNLLWLPDWGVQGFNLRWIVCYVIVLSANLFLAHVATRWLDEPFVHLGKQVANRLGLSPTRDAPSEAGLLSPVEETRRERAVSLPR